MLGFFPEPFPDETLYSLCSRYSSIVNYGCKATTIKELFGKSTFRVATDLPSYLDYFQRNIRSCNLKISSREIIEKYSLFPYYGNFLPVDRVKTLIRLMRGNDSKTIFGVAGLSSAAIQRTQKLKFCPVCAKSEISSTGIVYWHRLHQVPGVLVCHLHNCHLEVSGADVKENSYKAKLFAPSDYISFDQIRKLNPDDAGNEVLLQISRFSEWLLNNNQRCLGKYEKLEKTYIEIMKSQGLTKCDRLIRCGRLLDQFKTFYSPDLLRLLDCDFDDSDHNWVLSLVRDLRKTRVHHPLRHFLMINMLGHSAESFFNYCFQKKARNKSELGTYFIEGPYPCLNPVCPLYKKLLIRSAKITRSSQGSSFFSLRVNCKCGFSYARRGPDKEEKDIFRRDNILWYGRLWEDKLISYWKDDHCSNAKLGRILGVSSNNLIRRAAAIGLEVPRPGSDFPLTDAKREFLHKARVNYLKKLGWQSLVSQDIEGTRKKWIEVRKTHPQATRHQLEIKFAPKLFYLLKRYDKEWLAANQPPITHRSGPIKKVDWIERDKTLAVKIRQIADTIRNFDGRPVRVLPFSISKEIENRDWILSKKYLKRLPRSRRVLSKVTESEIDFKLRQVRWGINSTIKDGSSCALSYLASRSAVSHKFRQVPEILAALTAGAEEIRLYREGIM